MREGRRAPSLAGRGGRVASLASAPSLAGSRQAWQGGVAGSLAWRARQAWQARAKLGRAPHWALGLTGRLPSLAGSLGVAGDPEGDPRT
jgi:hypothetical protein